VPAESTSPNDSGYRAIYFSTLSGRRRETLRYLARFTFFDGTKIDKAISFVDLGAES
jgi:hypothetical protein